MSDDVPDEAPHEEPPATSSFSGRTAWARNLQTPLRMFLRTETGSAAVLLGMVVVALIWVNADASSYDAVWTARLSVRLEGAGVSLDLRQWVNSGLMTLFFFVFGLEARREFDMGELRERPPAGAARRGRPGRPGHPRRSSTWPSTPAAGRLTAGAWRCPRTRRSRSGRWR